MGKLQIGVAVSACALVVVLFIDNSQLSSAIIGIATGIISSATVLALASTPSSKPPSPLRLTVFFALIQLTCVTAVSLMMFHRTAFSVTGQMTYWHEHGQLEISDQALQSLWYGMLGGMLISTIPLIVIINSTLVGLYYRRPHLLLFIGSAALSYGLDQVYAIYFNMPSILDDLSVASRAWGIPSTGYLAVDDAMGFVVRFVSGAAIIIGLSILGWGVAATVGRTVKISRSSLGS